MTPAQAGGAPPIPTETGLTSKEAVIAQFFGIRSHRSPFNLSGVPACPCRAGSEGGLPLSVQIAGRPFRTRSSASAPTSRSWHEARPPLE